MKEQQLPGGNAGGAVLVDGTVRRLSGPWTPAVHALLRHLEARGFEGRHGRSAPTSRDVRC